MSTVTTKPGTGAISEELPDLLDSVLLKAEIMLELDVCQFIAEQVPDEPAVCRSWLARNIDYQERTNTLKLGIQTRLRKRTSDLKKIEAALREELKEEGFRAFEERSTMCHRDSRYRDLAVEVGNLETLYQRFDFLEWQLKGLAKFVTK